MFALIIGRHCKERIIKCWKNWIILILNVDNAPMDIFYFLVPIAPHAITILIIVLLVIIKQFAMNRFLFDKWHFQ